MTITLGTPLNSEDGIGRVSSLSVCSCALMELHIQFQYFNFLSEKMFKIINREKHQPFCTIISAKRIEFYSMWEGGE